MNRQELDNERLADFLRNVQDIEEIKNITRALAERIDQLERQGTGCDYFREKAREEGNFFKIVFEHAPIGMAIISLDGRCLQANPALCEMSGYSEEELMDLHLDKHTYPEDLELESAYREQMLQGKIQCYRMEKRFFHKLGYLVWTDFCVSLVKSKRGEPMFFIAQIQDISGHKRILEALKTSEKRFYRLADKAQDLFFSYRFYPKPGFQYVNRACQDVIGYKPEDFYADPRFFSKIIHPDDRYILKDILRSTLPNSEPIVMRLISKDKQIKWTEQYLVPYYDNANKLIAIEGVIRDITEKIRMQGEMARLESLNLVSEMAAAVGHEVRNPMTVVRGFLQMLADKEEFKEYLDYINLMIEELDRANSIITEFLSLAKKRPVKLEKQNLNSIINDLYALIQANALATQNNVVKRLENIPCLYLNRKEIHQLILNLCANGLEAMEPGGTLTISTYQQGKNVVLEIKDEGKGINPEYLDKLGTPFFTTKEKGTGLGLAVSYSIAKKHRAKIEVQTSPKGTSFFVLFPVVEECPEK